jgi:DNA-binding transcriptional MerR regulator
VITSDLRFRTGEVAKLAGVSLRQLQIWEEKRVAVASRSGRVRLYTASEALFVIIVAELRKRGLSFQRLRGLSDVLRQLLEDHGIEGRPSSHDVFVLTDGRRIQFADSPNKTCELVSNFSRPIVCLNLSNCLDLIEKKRLLRF